jgi:hypothetical protein
VEGSIEGGEVRRSEFDGAQRKTAAMAEAVVFWSLGSGKRRENARNRVQGCHWFWSAREIELRGAALLGPRRRRGGSREEVLGGVAKEGSSSARGQWVPGLVGAPREAETKLDLAVASQRGGRVAHGTGGKRAERQTGEGEKGPKRISKNSKDHSVN